MITSALSSPLISTQDDLVKVLTSVLVNHPLQNKDILVVASKVVAITQGRLKKIDSDQEFEALVRSEADVYYGGKIAALTQKNGIFIAWSGIDRSNVPEGYAVLWPEEPFKVAAEIRLHLKEQYQLDHLGVIISDSVCMPLRRGVMAVTLGYAGFEAVRDLRGHPDLYGKPLKVSQQAIADMLATSAHLVMGESNEQTPFAIIREAPVGFTEVLPEPTSLSIKADDCLYSPLWERS